MKNVSVLPTIVTAANGYCGILAVFKIADGALNVAAFLILLGMVFDMLDGAVARMAGSTSSFGAHLDSLSDAITFGVAPAFLVKALIEVEWPEALKPKLLAFLLIPFTLCALIRLARYNVEHTVGEGQGAKEFAGIPTPGAAGVVASLVFLATDDKALFDYRDLVLTLPFVCLLLGYLMVSRLPYFHFGKQFLGRRDFGYLFFVVLGAGLLTKFPHESFAVAFVAYALSGPIIWLWRGAGRRPPGGEGTSVSDTEEVRIPDGV